MRYVFLCITTLIGLLVGCGSPVAALRERSAAPVAPPAEVAVTAVPAGLISVVLFDEPE